MAIHFAAPFATKNDRGNFVEISSKISLLQLKFDEISTKFWTKFRRLFFGKMLWQNVLPQGKFRQNARGDEILPCGKTFCHNILPQKKSLKFRQRFRCVNSSSDEILRKF